MNIIHIQRWFSCVYVHPSIFSNHPSQNAIDFSPLFVEKFVKT